MRNNAIRLAADRSAGAKPGRHPAAHPLLRLGAGLAALIGLVAILAALRPRSPRSPNEAPTAVSPMEVVNRGISTALQIESPGKRAAPPAPASEPTPETRQLVDSLVKLEQQNGVLTQDQAAVWKRSFQGPGAVPAIREFLARDTDFDLGQEGRGLFGYASTRQAMFGALAQIGGAEAVAALAGTLQTTADPREIALLAQHLEQLDPLAHRQEALEAARQTLAMAAEGKLPDRDVAPLFEVFQNYGDTKIVADLQKAAGQWNYYATVALARLPEGAGVPALIEIAQSMTGPRLNALEMLAQLSGQYPEARAAMVEMARSNRISPSQWPYLTLLLAGNRYHYEGSVLEASTTAGSMGQEIAGSVLFGNQHFYTAPSPGELTPERVNQMRGLIDELLATTAEPAAVEALEGSKDLLSKRAPLVMNTPGQ